MKKLLLLSNILCLFFSFTLAASELKIKRKSPDFKKSEKNFEIVGETGRALYLIDVNSVSYTDDYEYIKFKLITSLKKPEKLNDGKNYSSVITTSLADCDDRRIKDIETEFYDGKMDNGDVTKIKLIKKDKPSYSPWFEAKTPGKVNTLIVSMACQNL